MEYKTLHQRKPTEYETFRRWKIPQIQDVAPMEYKTLHRWNIRRCTTGKSSRRTYESCEKRSYFHMDSKYDEEGLHGQEEKKRVGICLIWRDFHLSDCSWHWGLAAHSQRCHEPCRTNPYSGSIRFRAGAGTTAKQRSTNRFPFRRGE